MSGLSFFRGKGLGVSELDYHSRLKYGFTLKFQLEGESRLIKGNNLGFFKSWRENLHRDYSAARQ